MITASFDKYGRTAAAGGAYQYDTGQRIAMHGLPSPQELAKKDDFLSGDLVTVQAQFSYEGDSQAQMRLALWDEARRVWLAEVPDEYLTRSRDVHVYVYVYYGADEMGERAETAYEAVFCPISRPAPSGVLTQAQLEQWADLKAEIEISMNKIDVAYAGVQAAAGSAQTAAQQARAGQQSAQASSVAAQQARLALEEAGNAVGEAEMSTAQLAAGKEATAVRRTGRIEIGVPRGKSGKKGATGDTGPADVSFAFDDGTGVLTITTR